MVEVQKSGSISKGASDGISDRGDASVNTHLGEIVGGGLVGGGLLLAHSAGGKSGVHSLLGYLLCTSLDNVGGVGGSHAGEITADVSASDGISDRRDASVSTRLGDIVGDLADGLLLAHSASGKSGAHSLLGYLLCTSLGKVGGVVGSHASERTADVDLKPAPKWHRQRRADGIEER